MKIGRITARNYQRLTHVDIPVRAPLLLLAGHNEQGKTSIADAIYHAFIGDARRVSLKKDYTDLVHDGQKNGAVAIEILGVANRSDDEPENENPAISVTVPKDKRTSDVDVPDVMRFLLDQTLLPRLPPEERRKVLFSVTGTRISGKTILERLKAKGANEKKAADIGAVLLAGFDAAHKEAVAKASESRGAWKATTGEVYGSKKSEGWKAPEPTVVYDEAQATKLRADVAAAQEKVATLQTQQGELNQQRRTFTEQETRRTALRSSVERIPRLEAKLATEQANVDEWTTKVADTRAQAEGAAPVEPLTCPHCAGLVDLKDGKLLQHNPPKKVSDAQAKALLPVHEESLRKVTVARDNTKRDLEQAKNEKAALHELDQNGAKNVDQADLDAAAANMATARQHLQAVQATLDALEAQKGAREKADEKTKTAAGHHTDVKEWEAISEWLAPSGIQTELLTEALKPFNARLQQTALATGWDLVSIDGDMVIRVGGRAYGLASASARWRTQAALVEAIAYVSKVRTFMLDEVELLIGDVRMSFLKWMHGIAARGEVDTAILIGSFNEAPQCPPTFQVEWVDSGRAGVQPEPELAEAA